MRKIALFALAGIVSLLGSQPFAQAGGCGGGGYYSGYGYRPVYAYPAYRVHYHAPLHTFGTRVEPLASNPGVFVPFQQGAGAAPVNGVAPVDASVGQVPPANFNEIMNSTPQAPLPAPVGGAGSGSNATPAPFVAQPQPGQVSGGPNLGSGGSFGAVTGGNQVSPFNAGPIGGGNIGGGNVGRGPGVGQGPGPGNGGPGNGPGGPITGGNQTIQNFVNTPNAGAGSNVTRQPFVQGNQLGNAGLRQQIGGGNQLGIPRIGSPVGGGSIGGGSNQTRFPNFAPNGNSGGGNFQQRNFNLNRR